MDKTSIRKIFALLAVFCLLSSLAFFSPVSADEEIEVPVHTVSFYHSDGSLLASAQVTEGLSLREASAQDPGAFRPLSGLRPQTMKGFIFQHWCRGSQSGPYYDVDQAVTSSISLIALFKAVEEPAVVEPEVEEPAVEGPAVEEPEVEEPAVEESEGEEPAVEEPVTEEPEVEEPEAEEPAVEEPEGEEPAVEEPEVEEPAVEEPEAEEPTVEEPEAEEPAVEEPEVEEPEVEEPAVEEPEVEEPAVEEPAVEEPAVEEPAVEEPEVEEPAVEEPAVEEPAVEEPAVEEPAPPSSDDEEEIVMLDLLPPDAELVQEILDALDPGRRILIYVSWGGQKAIFGSTAKLIAVPEGYDDVEFTLQWQRSTDNLNWEDVSEAKGNTYDLLVTPDNYLDYWRVAVIIAGVKAD